MKTYLIATLYCVGVAAVAGAAFALGCLIDARKGAATEPPAAPHDTDALPVGRDQRSGPGDFLNY